jgi:hypothetical protein
MANIKIELGHPIIDGMPLSFRAPCNCNDVTGLKVIYHVGEDTFFVVFSFADAHGNNLKGLTNLFAAGAMVRVVLDTANAKAFIQNADTNAYLEGKFAEAMNAAAAAKNAADAAKTAAGNAQSTANTANSTANEAKRTADAALPKAGGTITGSVTFEGNIILVEGVNYGTIDQRPAPGVKGRIFGVVVG